MSNSKVAPQLVKFVEEASCNAQCEFTLSINNGLPLPCLAWTTEESAILRERMLQDNELLTSGFVRRMARSDLGNKNRYRASGIDIGEVRTQDSGAGELTECKITFNPVTFADFEKEFYVVNTEMNTRMCTRQFIGKRQQELISDQLSTYNIVEDFAQTDLASIIVAKIIQKFQDFLPEFMLLSSKGGSGRNLHGDDGVFAKAYYAESGIYFHTIEFDLTTVSDDFDNVFINAIVGGARYEKGPNEFGTAEEYILDFVGWLNDLKERRTFMFDVTFDAANNTIVVASNFVTRQIDLRIVLNDGALVDWGCDEKQRLEFVQLQERILINDKPLSFQYEKIDNLNFFEKFKNYKKEFMTYLHNNGFRDISIDQILIGIDPLLMLERQDYIDTQRLAGNFNANSNETVGFNINQFKPLNCLTDTGLFMMTIPGNILQLGDGTEYAPNVRIRESNCTDKVGEVEVLGGVPPVGSDVEAWGVFASNISDSWFVIDNKLAEKQPYKWTMKNLQCYDDNVRNGCAVPSACYISSSVSTEVAYDSASNVTTISVLINTSLNTDGTLAYNLDWALSDGTAGTTTVDNFVITVPGNQTNSGYKFSINGEIVATTTDGGTCKDYVVYTESIGSEDEVSFCDHTNTIDARPSIEDVGAQLQLKYKIAGVQQTVDFVNTFLNYHNNLTGTPYATAIPNEIEAILPGSIVTMTGDAVALVPSTTILIENVPSFITDIEIYSVASGNGTGILTATCS